MSKSGKILVLDPISPYSQHLCRTHNVTNAEIVFFTDDQTIEENLVDADILVTSTRKVPKEWIEKAQNCKLVQKLGTGVNNIDVNTANNRGIYVGNVAGANSLSVAEYAVMLMLASCRHINIAHNRLVQQGRWEKSTLRDSCCEVSGKTVGIVGFGNIGQKVAKLLSGFCCEILYYDLYRLNAEAEAALGVTFCELDELCSRVDILSLHTPLTEQTRNMIDERRLAMLKDSAVLVNTGRGGIIDETALYQTLKQGRLLGVALDVHEHEPVLAEDPLMEFERVIFSPHTAAGTRESMDRVIGDAFININGLLTDCKIRSWDNIVNRKEIGGGCIEQKVD
jgi:Phosphoglycerate dehydrogenase and related dehydrogenases